MLDSRIFLLILAAGAVLAIVDIYGNK